MKIKNIKSGKKIAMLGALILAIACFRHKINDEKDSQKIVAEPAIYEMNETQKTLNAYNSYLATMGSKVHLTENDLIKLKEKDLVLIKIDDDYIQVSKEDYTVYENSEGVIELGLDTFINEARNMLNGNSLSEDRVEVGTLGEFILENEISPIGITKPKYRSLDDKQKDFVKQYYNEDVLICLKENGFPVECYDVNDLYEVNSLKR